MNAPGIRDQFVRLSWRKVGSALVPLLALFHSSNILANMPWERAVKDSVGKDYKAYVTQIHGEYNGIDNEKTHPGIDIGGVCGAPVYPIEDGVLTRIFYRSEFSKPNASPGNGVIIDHGEFYTVVMHLASHTDGLTLGPISKDKPIGTVGDTGSPNRCHLHLEIRTKKTFRDTDVFHPGDGNCVDDNIYHPGDIGMSECFLRDWLDPMTPGIGVFDARGSTPRDFKSSEIRNGIDRMYSKLVKDAYARNIKDLSKPRLGNPTDNSGGGAYVHCWSWPDDNDNRKCDTGVFVQDFLRNREPKYQHGHTAIVLNTGLLKAGYLIKEGFWNFYFTHDGHANLGEPNSEEYEGYMIVDSISYNVTRQDFRKGALAYSSEVDFTLPYDDGITVLDTNGQHLLGTNKTHIVDSLDDGIELYLNGDPLCATPCEDVYFVAGWTYLLTSPDVRLTPDATYIPRQTPLAPSVSSKTTNAQSNTVEDPLVEIVGEHEFRFLVTEHGGTIVINPSSMAQELLEGPDLNHDGVVDLTIETKRTQGSEFLIEYRYDDRNGQRVLFEDTIKPRLVLDEISGSPAFKVRKKNRKSFITWRPKDVVSSELSVHLSTLGKTPNVYHPTYCGSLILNRGANLFRVDQQTGKTMKDPVTGRRFPPIDSADPLCFAVVKDIGQDGIVHTGLGDEDGDGRTDYEEACGQIKSNPCRPDTDKDGVLDYQEILNGTDPRDPDDFLVALFEDDFNDNALDLSHWTVGGHTVSEANGILKVDRSVTDDGGWAHTIPITIDPMRKLKVSRRVKINAANQYFNGTFNIDIEGHPDHHFGVSYADYIYTGNSECVTLGFSIFRNDANPHKCSTHANDMSPTIPPIWDTWFDEHIEYDPTTGELKYSINGKERIKYNVGALPSGATTIVIGISTWGWWTGHFQHLDDIRVTQ